MASRLPGWRVVLGWNALLAIAILAAPAEGLPGPVRMLAAGLVALVLPGAGWLGLFRHRALDPARLALGLAGLSTVAAIGTIVITSFGPEAPSRGLAVLWLALFMNAGLFLAGPPGPLDRGVRWGALAAVALAGFAVTSAAALRLVPPLEDHDMELRGSAYGLAAELIPYALTNRDLYVQAAHPVLFHVSIAESLLLTGELEGTRSSYDLAKRAEAAEAEGREIPWLEWWREDYEALLAKPALVGTRAPSCLVSALAIALLFHLATRVAGSGTAAAAAVVLYLSFPETIVRSSYAGYFPVTVFATLVAALLLTEGEEDGPPLWLFAAGAFAALVNHKTVVLVFAAVAWAGVRWIADRARGWRPDRGVLGLAFGFGAGTLLWWGYSYAVHAEAFIQDHLRKHIAHRFLLNDFRLGASPERYSPGMLEVWAEFSAHTGHLFVPAALVAVFWFVLRPVAWRDRRAAPLLALWFLIGAVLYTVTDWRQTKHLMNQLAPMVVLSVALAAPAFASARGTSRARRLALLALLVVAFLFNLRADYGLATDFSSFRISGASDIDGW